MVSVHEHVLNTNLLLYSYYMYEMYRSVLQRGGGPRKVYLLGASACRRPKIFTIYPFMAKYTTIL